MYKYIFFLSSFSDFIPLFLHGYMTFRNLICKPVLGTILPSGISVFVVVYFCFFIASLYCSSKRKCFRESKPQVRDRNLNFCVR